MFCASYFAIGFVYDTAHPTAHDGHVRLGMAATTSRTGCGKPRHGHELVCCRHVFSNTDFRGTRSTAPRAQAKSKEVPIAHGALIAFDYGV